MAWHDSTIGAHYSYGSTEATDNAWEIYNYFRGLSPQWAIESISAICGNAQLESVMNPAIRDSNQSGAFGLWQWISNKTNMINWANGHGLRPTSGPAQVQYLDQERQGIDTQWLGRGQYSGITFTNFATNSMGYTVAQLSHCFWACFERSREYQTDRTRWSVGYYEIFTGSPPPGPTPGNVPAWLLYKFKGGNTHGYSTILL